jgi:hypothetical protein
MFVERFCGSRVVTSVGHAVVMVVGAAPVDAAVAERDFFAEAPVATPATPQLRTTARMAMEVGLTSLMGRGGMSMFLSCELEAH